MTAALLYILALIASLIEKINYQKRIERVSLSVALLAL